MCKKNDTECLAGHHTAEQWAWVGVDSLLFVVILCGNLFTVYVLSKSSKLISNRFVLSLALTDTLVGLTLPYHMAFTIFPQLSVNKTTCILRFVFVLLACCCSILNVTAIAFDRYLAIIHPFKYETLMTKRVVWKVLALALFNAILMSTVPIYWNNWEKASVCELGQVLPRYFLIAVLLPAFLIIWAVMIAIYTRIWKEVVIQAEKLRRTNICHQCRPSFQVVLLVMGCFTICWLPFLGVACAQAAGYKQWISSSVYKAVLCLALSSSAINPLIYAWKNAEFKEAVHLLLKCKGKHQASVVTIAGNKNFGAPQTQV
ncbi:D(1)-like dopamine receptor [Cimex lectularius]|uniref:G-protein coupled receptors family 1 profile domain-containing protein n=1 Tax=Cimex lectularius TaxID=79782 RepID=A0A8I6RNK6_CIMLE|nr:D(1)-like dopamine receptor [Cimex lectularius]